MAIGRKEVYEMSSGNLAKKEGGHYIFRPYAVRKDGTIIRPKHGKMLKIWIKD